VHGGSESKCESDTPFNVSHDLCFFSCTTERETTGGKTARRQKAGDDDRTLDHGSVCFCKEGCKPCSSFILSNKSSSPVATDAAKECHIEMTNKNNGKTPSPCEVCGDLTEQGWVVHEGLDFSSRATCPDSKSELQKLLSLNNSSAKKWEGVSSTQRKLLNIGELDVHQCLIANKHKTRDVERAFNDSDDFSSGMTTPNGKVLTTSASEMITSNFDETEEQKAHRD